MSLSSTSSTDNHKDELPLINHGSEPTSVVKPQDTATSTIIVDESPQDSQISQSVSSSSVASSHEKKPKRPRKPPSTDPTKHARTRTFLPVLHDPPSLRQLIFEIRHQF